MPVHTKYIDSLWEFLQKQSGGISYQQVSRHLKVSSDVAKKMLYALSQEKSEEIQPIYLVSGVDNNNKHELYFLETKKNLEKVLAVHVYSVHQTQLGKVEVGSLYEQSLQQEANNSINGDAKLKKRSTNYTVPVAQPVNNTVIASKLESQPKKASISTENTKKNSNSTATTKDKGTVSSFFNRSSTKSTKQTKTDNKEPNPSIKKEIVKTETKKEEEEEEEEEVVVSTNTKRKRKNIVEESPPSSPVRTDESDSEHIVNRQIEPDSSSSDKEEEEEEDVMEVEKETLHNKEERKGEEEERVSSDEEGGSTPQKKRQKLQAKSSPTQNTTLHSLKSFSTVSPPKLTKKILKTKKYLNEKGYLVSQDTWEEVPLTEEELKEEQQKQELLAQQKEAIIKKAESIKDSVKSKPATTPSKDTKQGNIMSFFQKKR